MDPYFVRVTKYFDSIPHTKLMAVVAEGPAYARFTRTELYGRYGLCRVPVKAGWNKAQPWCEEHRKAVCVNSASTV
jgi:hypothetical protein